MMFARIHLGLRILRIWTSGEAANGNRARALTSGKGSIVNRVLGRAQGCCAPQKKPQREFGRRASAGRFAGSPVLPASAKGKGREGRDRAAAQEADFEPPTRSLKLQPGCSNLLYKNSFGPYNTWDTGLWSWWNSGQRLSDKNGNTHLHSLITWWISNSKAASKMMSKGSGLLSAPRNRSMLDCRIQKGVGFTQHRGCSLSQVKASTIMKWRPSFDQVGFGTKCGGFQKFAT